MTALIMAVIALGCLIAYLAIGFALAAPWHVTRGVGQGIKTMTGGIDADKLAALRRHVENDRVVIAGLLWPLTVSGALVQEMASFLFRLATARSKLTEEEKTARELTAAREKEDARMALEREADAARKAAENAFDTEITSALREDAGIRPGTEFKSRVPSSGPPMTALPPGPRRGHHPIRPAPVSCPPFTSLPPATKGSCGCFRCGDQ